MSATTKIVFTDEDLLKQGIEKLDDALAFIGEMKSSKGKILANALYMALIFAENVEMEEDNL